MLHGQACLTGRSVRSAVPKTWQAARSRAFKAVRAESATKKKVGFRWDGANLRWVKDERFADLAQDPDKTLIKPRTGTPYQAWPVVHTTLTDAGLKSISPQEAQALQSQGWTLVDVRLAADFEKWRAEGAVNVPLYRYVQGDTFWDNMKKLVMGIGFAMKATERNPNFLDDLLKVVSKRDKIILMCAIGGTLDTNVSYRREKKIYADPERAFGRESRSLKAAFELYEAGWSCTKMKHVEGGFQQWRYQGLPIVD
eukprot:jgi/Chrzof1/2970/Cz12g06140.t1